MDAPDPQDLEEMERSGAPRAEIDALLARMMPEIPVTPDEHRSIQLFARCQTQWKHHAMGGLLSLDYQGVEVVARALEMPLTPELLRDLQLMETAVVKESQSRGRRNHRPQSPLHRR